MLKAVVDTETYSLRTNAVILSIGAVVFDDSRVDSFDELVQSGLHMLLDQEAQFRVGRIADHKTLEWWKGKPEAASSLVGTTMRPVEAIKRLEEYGRLSSKRGYSSLRWYSRGPQFDAAKIEDLCYDFEIPLPWHYRAPRCVRTWFDEHGVEDGTLFERPASMMSHNALHDAAFEAYMMQRVNNGVPMELVKK